MFGLPSGTEWLLVIVLVVFFLSAKQAPQVRRQVARAIEDMREPEPVQDPPDNGYGVEILAAISLTLVALACIGLLVLAQSGWV